MDHLALYCAALQAEHDSIPNWSEMKDRCQRLGWNAGCSWVTPPQDSPTTTSWGEPQRQPPRSYSIPGNPDDRQPPEW